MLRRWMLVLCGVPLLALVIQGCISNSDPIPSPDAVTANDADENDDSPVTLEELKDSYGNLDVESIEFHDEVTSNREPDESIGSLEFLAASGETVSLKDFVGKKNVLLVFTRGFSGEICPYCTTQTSRLIRNHQAFVDRNTQVLLVYPGQRDQLVEFQTAALNAAQDSDSIPFPVLLDPDLVAVKQLMISAELAFPSTFIIDQQGNLSLSYVGKNPTDRPSIKALLTQLDELNQ